MNCIENMFFCLVLSAVILTGTKVVNADIPDNNDVSENLVSKDVKNVHVAVIGSGIGGASATHFLR